MKFTDIYRFKSSCVFIFILNNDNFKEVFILFSMLEEEKIIGLKFSFQSFLQLAFQILEYF